MGIFHKKDKETEAYSEIFSMLKPKDGKIHICAFNTEIDYGRPVLAADRKFTDYTETIIDYMQEIGYEIINLKVSRMRVNQGTVDANVHVVIMYK